jgi:hypothetical protein
MITEQKFSALERNYAAFIRMLPNLLLEHEGQYALMRDCSVVEYFASARDALLAGRGQFADDLFSVQQVRRSQADFGWFSRATNDPRL